MQENIKWEQVANSAFISAFRYDPEAEELEIQFVKSVATYTSVPQEVADEFAAAESQGKYFHANIRNTFDYEN